AFFAVLTTRRLPYLPYADAFSIGLAPGWAFGRAGCSLVHDHVGGLTRFPLAVRYPADHIPSGIRHNLGAYECLYALVLTGLLYYLARRPREPGMLIGVMLVTYAPTRFALDFLRATDVPRPDARYLGLTLNQYLSVVALAIGAVILWRAYVHSRTLASAP